MSDERPDDDDVERLDAPNQQVVRGDESGPAEEGSGGATAPEPAEPTDPEPEPTNEDDDPEAT